MLHMFLARLTGRSAHQRRPKKGRKPRQKTRAPQGRRLQVESLEDRQLLAVGVLDVSTGHLTITDNAGSTYDVLTLSLSGTNVRIRDGYNPLTAWSGGTQVDSQTVDTPLAFVTGGITFDMRGGSDTLTVDFSGGNPLPVQGLTLTGGSGSDTLAVTGGSFTNVTETFSSTTDGIVRLTQAGSVTRTIDYTGLSPVLLNVGIVADVVFHLPAGPNTNVVLADDGAAPDPNGNTANTSAIYGGTFEYTEFTNPANSLTVNLGPQGDTISVQTMDALFQPAGGTPLIINGGAGSDTFHVTPSATVPLHVNGGDPIGVLPGTGDTLNAVAAAFTLQPGPERDSGSFVSTAAAFAPLSFDQMERLRVNGAAYGPPTPSVPDLVATSDTFDNLGFGTPLGNSTDNLTNLSQPTFIGTGPAEGTVRIYAGGILVGEAAVGSDASDGTAGDGLGRWEVTVGPLADGSYPITAQVEDWAGNLSAASAVLTPVVVDTLPPQRPTLDLLAANDSGASNLDGVTNQASPISITVTGDVGSRVVIRNGAAVADDFTMPAGGTTVRTLALSTDGSYLLSAEAFDAAGNRSAQSEQLTLTVDRTNPLAPPAAPDLLVSSDTYDNLGFGVPLGSSVDNVTKLSQPAFSGTAEANCTVFVFANGVPVGQGSVGNDASDGVAGNGLGAWEVTVEPLADGSYPITASVTDLAGNNGALSAALTPVPIDTLPPQRPTLDLLAANDSGASNLDGVTNQASPVPITVTGEVGARVLIKNGQTVLDDFTMPAGGTTVRTLALATDGSYLLSAEAFDAAGNRSAQSEQLTLTVDRSVPAAPSQPDLLAASDSGFSATDNNTAVRQPAFSGTGEANAKVRVCANGELVGHGVVNTAGTWEITVEPLVDGVYNITAVQEDLAGNVSDASTSLSIVIDSYGPNSTLATASVLGSSPTVTLDAVTLHYQSGVPSDVDFFALTARDTGKLLVRATGTNLGLEVQDSTGATIVTTTATTNPTLTLPVVSRQTYYVRLTNTASAANQYALELENIAVPQPTLVTLLPADDTGLSNYDSITRLTTPRFLIQADLARFASGITLEATAGFPGIDVELVITDSLGHEWIANAARVGLSSLWSATSTALPTGTYPAAVAARVVVTDGQTAPQTDTSPLSSSTVLYVDTEAPAATTPTLAFYSDTGTVGDGITNQRTPAYTGLAEANSLVRLFVSTTANPAPVVIGQTTAGSDQSDSVPGDGWGRWEITSEPLQDGSYTVWAVVEDLAGNSSLPSSTQTIEVDTQTSNSTFRDLLFDFGSGNSPVAPGYVGVPAEQRYALAQGYGWTTAVSGFDRGAIRGAPAAESDLLRDGAWSGAAKAKRTFRADLLAGDYQVTVMLGDASYARDKMQVKANGNVVTPPSGVNTATGQFAVVSFPVTVISSLQLEFSDLGGNPYWMANGVTIRSAVTPGTLNGPGAVPADGTTLDTFVQTGLKGGDLYTVTTTLGTMTTADANPLYAGTQVAVDAGGKLSFQVLRPLAAGTATVTAQEVTGKGWATGTATYTIPDVRRFDFNGSNNITASGFIGVRGKTTYSASLGYGWNVAAREFERTGPTALRRDGHYGVGSTGNRFTMQVDPAKQYLVRVYVGDASYLRDKIQVTVEGAASYTIAALAAGSFDARVTTAPLSASSDGKLTVTIRDLGGNSTWVVNGIDIWTSAATDPGAQQLRAETMALGANGSGSAPGVTLSSAALAPVVEQAIGIWAATGLSASQVALLRSTPVVVGDLNAQGCLGITTPDRIVIDDDGAGWGWSYGGRKAKNRGSAVSSLANQPASFDLLTVVLHEMGHVLGHDHDRAADDLMAAVLQPGVLRLPMVDAVFVGW